MEESAKTSYPPRPGISRLQLAAALLEYDNDLEDPYNRRSHRDSAIFRPFQPPPLSGRRSEAGRPEPQPSEGARNRNHRVDPRQDGHYDSESRSANLVDAKNNAESRPGPSSSFPENDQEYLGERETVENKALSPEVQNLDVSRWDLPAHLVPSHPSPHPISGSPSPISPLTIPALRPDAGSLLANVTRLSSNPTHTPSVPALPATRHRVSFSLDRQDVISQSLGPKVQNVTSSRVPITTPGPVLDRAKSINIDVMDGLDGRTDDDLGVESALEAAERVQRLAASHSKGNESDIDFMHTKAGSRSGMSDISTSRPASRGTSGYGYRPGSSASHYRQLSNPLMIPLPASPTSSTFNVRPRSASRLSGYTILSQAEEEVEEVEEELDSPNPFALPAPPPELGSRFDPKVIVEQRASMFDGHQARPSSRMTLLSRSGQDECAEDDRAHDMAQLGVRTHRQSSLYDPAYAETGAKLEGLTGLRSSMMGSTRFDDPPSQQYAEIPDVATYGKPLRPPKYHSRPTRISRHSLLRPRTLIMPAPLQGNYDQPVAPEKVPDGFTLGEKPLPAGARTSVITIGGKPMLPLSLSQKTFRSSLMVDGWRDDGWVGGTEIEGEIGVGKREGDEREDEERKPGKLYGTSLMDQLEARKNAMRNKQRVFTGDSRPAMMARGTTRVEETSPISLNDPRSATSRRVPLLQFDSNGDLAAAAVATSAEAEQLSPVTGRMTKSKSVFGVDQIWEKEMAKLKVIQEQEAKAQAEREASERDKEARKEAKSKRGAQRRSRIDLLSGKKDSDNQVDGPDPAADVPDFSPIKRISDLPPTLTYSPEKPKAHARAQAPPESRPSAQSPMPANDEEALSEEEQTGTVRINRGAKWKGKGKAAADTDKESEEDVPLSRLAKPATSLPRIDTAPRIRPSMSERTLDGVKAESSDDEDGNVPLSRLRNTTSAALASASKPNLSIDTDLRASAHMPRVPVPEPQPAIQPITPGVDEDDVPLLFRQAHVKASAVAPAPPVPTLDNRDDEDDVPLAFRQSRIGGQMPPSSMYGAQPASAWGLGMDNQFQQLHLQHFQPPSHHTPRSVAGPPMPFGYQGYPAYPSYPFPAPASMANMNMNAALAMSQMLGPLMSPSMAGMHLPPPFINEQGNEKNIDDWRKKVAVAPAPSSVGE